MSEKKQNFLQGTALLAMATAIVKVIGAIYKIPLNAIIGKQGFSYYSTAYEIYAVLLMVSTAGLPVAMSRMISEASAQGHYNQVRKIYNTARAIFLGLGLAGALLIILLFAAAITRGYWIALNARDRFSTVLAAGLVTLIAVQTVLNLGVVTNLLPSTGIALPFFSYGGTALAVNLGEIGIVLGISRQRHDT